MLFDQSAFPTTSERFMRYAAIDTQADPLSTNYPSSEKQKELSKLIASELELAGISFELNEFGYIYARIPSNSNKKVPTICFCAHLDTAPDCSGSGVKPLLHRSYNGDVIILPDDPSVILDPAEIAELAQKKGEDIITASGLTLLGADDKAGVCCIMEASLYLLRHPEIKHGEVVLLFTTDEEIGRGVDKVDIDKLKSDFGYTMDSGALGSFEDETFSADACSIEIDGISTHPGYAKGKMQNALKIASEIIASLPKDRLCPEATDEREGFVHPTRITGELGHARIEFILRDFDTEKLTEHYNEILRICDDVTRRYPGSFYKASRKEQYRNMKEVLVKHPEVSNYAIRAIQQSGISLKQGIIRGGTDGSRLSFMGLPCPNIFAGEQAIHSKKEWVSVQDMQKASEVIVRILSICEAESKA